MRRRLLGLVLLSVIVGPAEAQVPAPTTAYKLHAQKEQHSSNLPSTLLYLLPDQALCVLIPQQDSKWVFKRISSWDTDKPKEETVVFSGQPHQEGTSGYEDLKVDPTGTYALIRLKSFTGNIFSVTGNRSAVIVLVDLRAFTISSQLLTGDPLLAASDWLFTKQGELIASAQVSRITVPAQLKHPWEFQSITDTYMAISLKLPKLEKSAVCEYERILDFRDGINQAATWHIGKVGIECAPLVEAAHVTAVDKLPGGEFPSSRYANFDRPCQFQSESPSVDFALFGCRTGSGYFDDMVITTKSRSLDVVSTSDGKLALSIPLPHNLTPYPALLANAAGHTWLLILRDGIKLETYRLP